ncbi:MAG: (Fe-S)-binding protein [Archaeoglobaceae archaeon]
MELRFNADICRDCEIFCLSKCRYLSHLRREFVKVANGEFSRILEECRNCYACEEFCPYENHPFYRIVELQEKFGIKKVPDNVMDSLLRRYEPEGEFKPKKVKKALHICLFPEFKDLNKTRVFQDYEVVRGRHLFCNLVYLHFGKISVIKERAKKVIENMKSLEFDEVVLFHDECYSFYNSFLPAYGIDFGFKIKHIFEHFIEYISEREVRKLGFRVAYQRPCSNRLNKTDELLDEIFEKIGVERVERKYDRENSICCGAPFTLSREEEFAEELQSENIEDIVKTKAKKVAFLCPMCFLTLSEKVKERGLQPVMIHELFEMALI